MRLISVLAGLLFWMGQLRGQDADLVRVMEDQAGVEENRESEEDLQQLHFIQLHPLDLNRVQKDELAVFPFLTAGHIEQFLAYRDKLGPLHHVLELQAVPLWEPMVIRKILPYVKVGTTVPVHVSLYESWKKGENQLLWRTTMSKNAGFLLRYQFSSTRIRYGVNLEKDRGERLFQPGKGVAFLSAHLSVSSTGFVKHLVIGDYLVNFGQGLLLWQGRGMRKNGMAVMIKRQLPWIQNYRSNDENRYMRGAAAVFHRKAFDMVLFLSRNRYDANLNFDTVSGTRYVSSLVYSGIHRTAAELADKNLLAAASLGFGISYTLKNFRVAYHQANHYFSLPLKKMDEPYNLYAISGRQWMGRSIACHFLLRNAHVFGEWAVDKKMGLGMLQGVMMSVDRRVDLAILYRKIGQGYRAFASNAFTEGSEPNNEEGFYTGVTIRALSSVQLDMYADHFRSPWVRYRVDAPSWGTDYFMQISCRPDKKTLLLVRWKREEKMENEGSGGNIVKEVFHGIKENLRIHLEYHFNNFLEWRTRLEWVVKRDGQGAVDEGVLYFNDLIWRSLRRPVSGSARLLFYDSRNYDTRIYAYENDVMFYNIVPAYYGRGMLFYLNMRFELSDRLNFFIKCSGERAGTNISWYSKVQLIFSW